MTWRVLVTAPYMLPILDQFEDFFREHDIEVIAANVLERLEEDELLPLVGDVHGIVAGDDRITARVLDAAPKLKVVCKWGTGIDSFDSEAAAARGIAIRRTVNAFTHPVSDSVLGYILCFARNLHLMDSRMKGGEWRKIPGRALNESTVGVIGVGNVGKAIIRRLVPFGARILGNDIIEIDTAFVEETGMEVASLEQILDQSDFIATSCELNDTSYHLMNAERFARMKDTAFLVNAARGPIIDEKALVSALEAGSLAGVALDVFEDEPLPEQSPLKGMSNTMLAPHNSNSSPKAWQKVHENTLRMLAEELSGKAT
jgi:D-3-phosphoglycerate dehydrogenase / 2-oxoglutarate reductase